MPSLRTFLKDELLPFRTLTYESLDAKSIEIWSTNEGLQLKPIERNLSAEDIPAWIDQLPPYDSPYPDSVCHLRLLYQQWPVSLGMYSQRKVPFTEDVFHHLSEAFSLSPEYLHQFCNNNYTPLHVTLPLLGDDHTKIVLQSPNNISFTTLSLSHHTKTGLTCAYLGYEDDDFNEPWIKLLKESQDDISHPLLLPTLFFKIWVTVFLVENDIQIPQVREISHQLSGMLSLDLSTTISSSESWDKIDQAHMKIIKIHDVLNNGKAAFINGTAANLRKALDSVPDMVMSVDKIAKSHRDFEALLSATETTVYCEVDARTRTRERLSMQLQVLYNLMQRKDSKTAQQMAKHSSDIAKASLSDSNEMRHLAADTKKIAEATRLDSAAMKTIAIVTMLFLPGTAIAAILSMGSFFDTGADGKLVVSTQFWIYWALTIPMTIAVFISWWFKNHADYKKIVKPVPKEDTESERIEEDDSSIELAGIRRPETTHRRSTQGSPTSVEGNPID